MAFVAPIAAFIAANAGTIGAVAGVASAAVSGVSAISQGNYQAAVAKYNAKTADANAARAMEAAQLEAQRSDVQHAALLAQQVSEAGASGLDIGSRSFGQGRMLTERVRAAQSGDITREGASASARLLQDAANYRAQGSQARTQGYLGAAGSALDAASALVKPSLVSKTKRYAWDEKVPVKQGPKF